LVQAATGNNVQAAALQYKLIKKIKDDRFDEELIHQYHLLVHIGTRDFQLLVIDPQENRVLLLEDFVLPGISSHTELMVMLDQLFDSHAVLKAGFWKKVKVSIKNQKFVQVPLALFSPNSLKEYLKFNAPIDAATEEFMSSTNFRAEAVTVFAINKDLKDWLTSIYPNSPPIFTHQSAALIEGTMQFAEGKNDTPLYVYIDRFKLHIIACKKGKLLYYNQFAIKQFSDYVKYIMMVMKTLNLDQESSQVVLWGYIGKNSPHYVEFYKYISNVTFGSRPAHLAFGYMFDEAQEHHFFDLYSINLIN
jgi:Protein of unknown function (DUF3822)